MKFVLKHTDYLLAVIPIRYSLREVINRFGMMI
ncbi:hypothetical protein ABIB60_003681 [Hymenobacter sp. UYP22]